MPKISSRFIWWLSCPVFILILGGGVWAAEVLRVSTLTRAGQILVSVELAGAYTDDIRSTVQSGLQTTFRYEVQLTRETKFWADPAVATVVLAATVRYDSLTEQYSVSRTLDGNVIEAVVADQEEEVRILLTRFERIPVFRSARLEPNAPYRVIVKVETLPRNSWFIWPWVWGSTSGSTRFTFLP